MVDEYIFYRMKYATNFNSWRTETSIHNIAKMFSAVAAYDNGYMVFIIYLQYSTLCCTLYAIVIF